jgi:hypothetical protein
VSHGHRIAGNRVSLRVCLLANALDYPDGGGHLWVYLNWALGLRSLGCEVTWLECERRNGLRRQDDIACRIAALKSRLAPYGLADRVAVHPANGSAISREMVGDCLDLDAADDADLLLNLQYFAPPQVVDRFRRSALLDIDPGLLQLWASQGLISLARHDVYFTIGETVGRPGARFPDLGKSWLYSPPCVSLDWWHPAPRVEEAPFTTLSHWWADEWVQDGAEVYDNTKRAGFLPFLGLPGLTAQPLELALNFAPHEDAERTMLREHGWRIRESAEVSSTPGDYQRYIQQSGGEFSCAKPSCVRLQNAWISDRTLCYLASGKPAVVQHTGPSSFLPDDEGLFRFRDLPDAARALDKVASDLERQGSLARALAEEYFDARKVVGSLLERALN